MRSDLGGSMTTIVIVAAALFVAWLAGCLVGWCLAQAWELNRPRATTRREWDDDWPPFSRN